jgi:hypothetical protein
MKHPRDPGKATRPRKTSQAMVLFVALAAGILMAACGGSGTGGSGGPGASSGAGNFETMEAPAGT